MASIDWDAVKIEYVTTSCTYQELADKYGVAIRTVIRRAGKGDWQQARKEHVTRVSQLCHMKAAEKIAEKKAMTFAEYAVEQQSDLIELNRLLIEKAKQTLGMYDEALSPRDLKSISSMITDLTLNNEKMKADMKADEDNRLIVEFVPWGDDE
jgi:hypothetical protein